MALTLDALLNDFAVRSFRDVGDGDYIAARMAYRADLLPQFLWSSQQAIEKYLKCILLLNRVPAKHVMHDLSTALAAIHASGKVSPQLTEGTQQFIARLDRYGWSRYLEVPNLGFREDIISLDRAAWELRRYCTLAPEPHQLTLRDGVPPPRLWIAGGHLENILSRGTNAARAPLVWQNAFFGKRLRKTVRIGGPLFRATNSPLTLNPHFLDEVLKYVHLPKDVVNAYRSYLSAARKTT